MLPMPLGFPLLIASSLTFIETAKGCIKCNTQSLRGRVMEFNVTFNNISVTQWRSVLLVEEIEVPGETHRPAVSHCQTLYCCIDHTSP